MTNSRRLGLRWAAGSALGIGAFVIPWKLAAEHGDTSTNTLVLLASAAVFNSLLVGWQQRAVPRFGPFDLLFAALLAALTLAGNLASAHAIVTLSPAVLTLAQRSEVVIVALLAWPLIGERVERRYWLGSGLAALGLLHLLGVGEGARVRTDPAGLAWGLAAALAFSAIAVLTRRFILRIDLVAVNALRLWLSVALWFLLHGLPPTLARINPEQVLWASLAALAGPFLGRLCLMMSARYVEARVSTLVSLSSPVLTLVLAWLLLGQWPARHEIEGGIIMLAGIAIPIVAARRQPGPIRSRRAAAPSDGSVRSTSLDS